MTFHINDGGTWKEPTEVHINDGGVWKKCQEIHINDGGVWKKILSALAVSALCNGDTNLRLSATCYAGLKIDSDGEEYEALPAGGYGSTIGTWLDSGLNSEVWVECIVTAGTWDVGPVSTRLQCNIDRQFYMSQTTAGTRTTTCYFKFWDAASGGNLLQQTASASYVAIREDS